MEPGDHDDEVDPAALSFRTPPPPDDRIWRHPSEMHWPDTRVPTRRAWPLAVGASLSGSLLTVGLLTVTGAFQDAVPVLEALADLTGFHVNHRPVRPGSF